MAFSMSARGKFTTGQTWGALKKAWKGYKIAKVQSDKAKMTEYAKKIKTLQGELGIKQSSFPEVGV
jgi:hypothetical protein